MEKEYKIFIDRVQNNISYHLRSKKDSEYGISVNFLIDGKDKSIFDNEKSSVLSQVKSLADYYQPEKILVKFKINGNTKVFDQDFKLKNINDSAANQNNAIALNGFQGLGQVSVDEYIQKKLDEDRVKRNLQELQKELNDKNSELNSISDELSKANETIEKLENEKQELNQTIESKQTVRYWAGLTGDILESIGIKKENLKEPLAGLVSSESPDSNLIDQSQTNIDESDFVEASPEQSQRDEIITLIKDFLSSLDNQKLSEVFIILSEIEQKKDFTEEIINHFNLKTK